MAYPNGQERQPGGTPTAAVMSDKNSGQAQHQKQNTAVAAPGGTAFAFRRAVKQDAKLRFAICGPSGSGKTFTLLKLASELGGPVALVDTERGSASKYADLFEFDVLELDSYDPARLIEIIDSAASHGYRVLCIDSLSHFWMGKDGELDQVDRAARRMQTQNSFAAWKHVTPVHNRLVDAIISAPLHILVSMRSKTEWVLDRDEKTGKTTPRKLGLAPVMRDGIEYEFDVCGDMDHENTLMVTKSRCPALTGGAFPKPGAELAGALKAWLAGAGPQPNPEPTAPQPAPDPEKKASAAGTGHADKSASKAPFTVPEELASIWRRMCSPRGVVKEFDELKAAIEQLAGSTGVAEFHRILREHGVERAREFTSVQPVRMCAKQVFALLEELRSQAQENFQPLATDDSGGAGEHGSGEGK